MFGNGRKCEDNCMILTCKFLVKKENHLWCEKHQKITGYVLCQQCKDGVKIERKLREVTQDELLSPDQKLAICRQCIQSTTDDLDEHDNQVYSRLTAKVITAIGNWLKNKGIDAMQLRCKLCGCSCNNKSKFGSIVERLSWGRIAGNCPQAWEDGKSNWEHGEPLHKKENN